MQIYIDNEEYEVLSDGLFNALAGFIGKELQTVELTDESDGSTWTATICRETKQVWLTGRRNAPIID